MCLVTSALVSGCSGILQRGSSLPQCPIAPPCPVCEPKVCRLLEPQIIEREKIVTRTVEVPAPRPEDALAVFGRVEKVFVEAAGVEMNAEIDTGVANCVLDARDIVLFERDGRDHVRFTLKNGKKDQGQTLELPVKRHITMIRASSKPTDRTVVEMWLRIGKVREKVEVTLANRRRFDYPVLIGRNFLTDNALVDVSRKRLAN